MTVKHVAFLSSEYPPRTYGGLGTTVEALSRYLAALGVHVTILVPGDTVYTRPPLRVDLLPVPVEHATSDEDYWLTYSESAVRAARSAGLRPDLVHAHDWMAVLGGLAIGRDCGAPVLLSVHLPQTGGANRVLEDVGLCRSDGVLVNSNAVRGELSRRGLETGQVFTLPNGVDLARFVPAYGARNAKQILYVGRLVPQKGVDVLLRSFGAVLRRHSQATLVVAGDGQQRLYLERLARFLGVSERVTFLGWCSTAEVAHLYRSATVTCVPSLYEPFGLVALEAMASGCPVVVSMVGGLAEILDDQIGGVAVEPGDHLGLATAIASFLGDFDHARETGAAARRRAELFDWAAVAEQTRQLYDELADRERWVQRRSDAPATPLDGADEELKRRATRLLHPDIAPGCPTERRGSCPDEEMHGR